MDSTPLAFYQRTIGRQFDVDNYPKGDPFQCWDYMAEQADSNNVPWQKVLICRKTGYVQDLWDLRYFSGILDYYDEVSPEEFQNGDFVIWPFSYSYTPKSHVAMFWNDKAVGQNQSGNKYVCAVDYLDFRRALGGFRLKQWEDRKTMYIGSGVTINDQYAGQDIIIYGMPDGDKPTLISAKTNNAVHGNDVQLIGDIDDSNHIYDAKMNANFFVMEDGTALGVRCGMDEWSIPQQNAFYFYSLDNDGNTEIGMDYDFPYFDRSDIAFACSPGLILMHNGQDCEYVSPEVTWKRNQSNTQSLLIRTADRFAFAIVKGNLTPDQIRAWAKSITGIRDLCFMDSGGSSCLQIGWSVNYATSEKRKISNALAFYRDKNDPVAEKPKDEEIIMPPTEMSQKPQDETTEPKEDPVEEPAETVPVIVPGHYEEDDMEEKKTIPGQIAKLIDVKSLITLSLTLAFVRLALNGTIDQQQMMTIYTVIIGFYFGTQATKK